MYNGRVGSLLFLVLMQEMLSPIAFPSSMNIMPMSLSNANLSVMTFLNLNSLYTNLHTTFHTGSFL